MASFKAGGRDWPVRLNVGLLGDLRAEADFDLGKATQGNTLVAVLFGDPERLALALWAVCRADAERAGLDRDAFWRLLDDEALEGGATAFLEAVTDFFHRTRAPEIRKRLPGLTRKLNEKLTAAVTAAIDSTSSGTAGDSPASSASTPAP